MRRRYTTRLRPLFHQNKGCQIQHGKVTKSPGKLEQCMTCLWIFSFLCCWHSSVGSAPGRHQPTLTGWRLVAQHFRSLRSRHVIRLTSMWRHIRWSPWLKYPTGPLAERAWVPWWLCSCAWREKPGYSRISWWNLGRGNRRWRPR